MIPLNIESPHRMEPLCSREISMYNIYMVIQSFEHYPLNL